MPFHLHFHTVFDTLLFHLVVVLAFIAFIAIIALIAVVVVVAITIIMFAVGSGVVLLFKKHDFGMA